MKKNFDTPYTNAAIQQCEQDDEAMLLILQVYSMEGCRETLMDLIEMPLDYFLSLKEGLNIMSSFKEEAQWNNLKNSGQI